MSVAPKIDAFNQPGGSDFFAFCERPPTPRLAVDPAGAGATGSTVRVTSVMPPNVRPGSHEPGIIILIGLQRQALGRYFVQSPKRLPLYFIVISPSDIFIFIQPS
jgi:hypothetical protein